MKKKKPEKRKKICLFDQTSLIAYIHEKLGDVTYQSPKVDGWRWSCGPENQENFFRE